MILLLHGLYGVQGAFVFRRRCKSVYKPTSYNTAASCQWSVGIDKPKFQIKIRPFPPLPRKKMHLVSSGKWHILYVSPVETVFPFFQANFWLERKTGVGLYHVIKQFLW